jgi:predicted porin
MAVIGAGIQNDNNDKAAQSSFSLNVPMGALQAGLVYSHRNAQNAGVVNGVAVAAADSRSGTAVGLQYNMSKMTNVNVSYGTYSNNAAMDNEFRVRLMKSF